MEICVFGDSVAKGVVLDNVKNKYTFLKSCCVNLFAKDTGVRLDNYAKFGCTVTKGLDIVQKHTGELGDYDYVALEFGGNDCNYDWAAIAEAPEADHAPQTPPGRFLKSYERLVEMIRESGGRPVLVNLPPLDAERFFAWVSKGLSGANILKWLEDVGHIFRWQAGYNLLVEELAQDTGTPLVDIRRAFLGTPDYRDLICEDGMHPNAKGHAFITQAIEDHVHRRAILA